MNKALIISMLISSSILVTGCSNQAKRKEEAMIAQQARISAAEENRARRLEAEKLEREKNEIREAYAKEAPTRNAEKIKRLGLPQAFEKSTIYRNFLGAWSDMMPADRWVGLLLENPKINSVEAISHKGMPGIFIKRSGRPGIGFIFRIEGNEAYPYAIMNNGSTQLISEKEQSGIAIGMIQLTNANSMD